MAKIANPSFPTCTDQKVVLSRLRRSLCSACHPDGDNDIAVRGPDGLRPGVVSFPWVRITKNNTIYQPVACIAAEEPVASQLGACWVSIDALDRCSWWVKEIAPVGSVAPGAVPPQINFEIRPATGGVSDLSLAGVTNFLSYEDHGELAQVSGTLCGQWELWARIDAAEPDGSQLDILVQGAADRLGGGVFNTKFGLLASIFPPGP